METSEINTLNAHPENFESILQDHKLNYRIYGNYLLVGDEPSKDDRIIYISVVQSQIPVLLKELLPFLSGEGLNFKMVRSIQTAKWLLDGKFGYEHIGKVIIIFLPDSFNYSSIVTMLANLTKGFKGPIIPGSGNLGGTVYRDTAFPPLPEQNEETKVSLIQGKYLVLSHLKKDAKGDVMAGLYFNRFFLPGRFVIKEGRYGMWSDQIGRDMKDRMEWQHHIHMDLQKVIDIPKAIDLFQEKGNTYLVMEFIKGTTLDKVIAGVYKNRSWLQLSVNEKLGLLKLFNRVLEIVEKIHAQGYVHRDLSPVNFMLTASGKLYLMDFELAFSTKKEYPLPAFGFGTFGFMSPEQIKGERPSFQEDIYALGALMIAFFTNMPPLKFDVRNLQTVADQLMFFTGNNWVSELAVVKSLNTNPACRPALSELKEAIAVMIKSHTTESDEQPQFTLPHPVQTTDLRQLITRAYAGLIIPEITDQAKLFKKTGKAQLRSGNRRIGAVPGIGLMVPITGILYLLGKDKPVHCPKTVLNFIASHYREYLVLLMADNTESPGLFFGLAGKALALYCGHKPTLSSAGDSVAASVYACFNARATALDLANGVAGQLLAALVIYEDMPSKLLKNRMDYFINIVQAAQHNDGSWPLDTLENGKKKMQTGLAEGAAGIIITLVKYDILFQSTHNKTAIKKGLDWLKRNKVTGNESHFSNRRKSNMDQSLISGSFGVALTFLYAFDYLKLEAYKVAGENILLEITDYPVCMDYTLSNGLSGWGLVYTEAYRITLNQTWLNRASWIYQVLANTAHAKGEAATTWNMIGVEEYDGALLSGTAGIILFLATLERTVNTRPYEN